MKAVVKRGQTPGQVKFEDVEEGDWFMYQDMIHTKLDSYNLGEDDANVVWYDEDDNTFNVCSIDDDALVTPIQVTISY